MNIENIRFIEAVVNEGSIRKAADKMFISQPAISTAIKKLEQELNIELFDKESYRAVLTDDGKAFYERSKKVLDEFKKLEEYALSLKKGIETEIKISIDAIFNINKVIPIINNVMADFHETKLTIAVDYMEKVVNYLDEQKYDLIICPIDFVDTVTFDLEKVFLEEITMYHVISPSCSLASMEKITDHDLKNLPQTVIRSGSEKSMGILEEAKKWYVNDFFLKKIIIMQGLAWGMIPEYYMENELAEGKLIPLKNCEKFRVFKLQVFALRKKNLKHGIVAEAIWNTLKTNSKI